MYVGVVLVSARVNRSVARIPVCVGVEVGIVALCNLVRDTREFQDALLKSKGLPPQTPVEIQRGYTTRRTQGGVAVHRARTG